MSKHDSARMRHHKANGKQSTFEDCENNRSCAMKSELIEDKQNEKLFDRKQDVNSEKQEKTSENKGVKKPPKLNKSLFPFRQKKHKKKSEEKSAEKQKKPMKAKEAKNSPPAVTAHATNARESVPKSHEATKEELSKVEDSSYNEANGFKKLKVCRQFVNPQK